ncbi:Hypothetical predicted protein [Cloeon dipterum]|uniref:Methylcrotonoyl-CoA carboxylase subunit alpha, mitochondrial n=2 Tax=Cloeon dipterum TaxID=197152 RepID=A0A8S1DIP9_9INSE|nr:Hypothetical predicted protein [Cloeon dipterum]
MLTLLKYIGGRVWNRPSDFVKLRWHHCGQVEKISKVLIANRGEIACRVMKTAKKMGIQTVAVYSDADADSMHVDMADEAVRIGVAASGESYLRQDRIIEAAKRCGAQAIHPGYGFLSENAEFAELCHDSGIIFVGPPPSAIRDMGIKSTSKSIMSAAGVPVIEGYHGDDQSDSNLLSEAEKIGFPVMIKAVRGGGGKGMRIAQTKEDFLPQLESARREAQKAFGDQVMLVEKFVSEPRHVEVQVFGDKHGNYVYLFERDCSVQRRHQKVIEEAPAPGLTWEERKSIGEAAVKAARAVNYVGAGTVEFVLGAKDHKFYFMEMNTRLQVEHPVSEMITGTDLVQWQLQVAAGEPLPVTQEQLQVNGHSLEARIYAEEPGADFMPGAGPLIRMTTPPARPDVRVETGVRQGDEVSVHYDPMIAKLVVWAENRQAAIIKLKEQLSQFNVVGLNTNIDFLMSLCSHKEFLAGNVHTNFIPEHQATLFPERSLTSSLIAQATVAALLTERAQLQYLRNDPYDPFSATDSFRLGHNPTWEKELSYLDKPLKVKWTERSNGVFTVDLDGQTVEISGVLVKSPNGETFLKSHINGKMNKCRVERVDGEIYIFTKECSYCFKEPEPSYANVGGAGLGAGGGAVAPMPGVIEKVLVKDGDVVEAGAPLVVMIAMKMEYVIRSPKAGKIERVLYAAGDNVKKNAPVVKMEESQE